MFRFEQDKTLKFMSHKSELQMQSTTILRAHSIPFDFHKNNSSKKTIIEA